MSSLSDIEIRSALSPYDFVPSSQICSLTRAYIETLLRWNQRISLTTVTEPAKILRFHFGESLFAIKAAGIELGRLADVGSGAGFPGLALALALPGLQATLIESSAKKTTFLAEVVRTLNLPQVRVLRERMEDISGQEATFDFITARAVGNHEELLSWAQSRLTLGGAVVLWLGEQGCEEILSVDGWVWSKPAHIPGSRSRFILSGSPRS
ncbi:MAG: 16S rRNA (guanine(527)-N(7))-methyltransferase RsmG [Candidatus Acidiferrales bacterium]